MIRKNRRTRTAVRTKSAQTSRRAHRCNKVLMQARASHIHTTKSLIPVQNSTVRPAALSGTTPRRSWRRHNHQELPRAGDSHPRLSSTCARGLAWPLAGRRGTPLPPQHRSRSKERATKKMTMICCYASPRSARTFSRKACCRADSWSPSMSITIGCASWLGFSISKQRRHLVHVVERAAPGTRDGAHSRGFRHPALRGSCGD